MEKTSFIFLDQISTSHILLVRVLCLCLTPLSTLRVYSPSVNRLTLTPPPPPKHTTYLYHDQVVMVLFAFGDYAYLCRNIPSLPPCNLFFRQLFVHPYDTTSPATNLLGLPSTNFDTALSEYASGSVNPACAIARMGAAGGQPGSLGNIANIIL